MCYGAIILPARSWPIFLYICLFEIENGFQYDGSGDIYSCCRYTQYQCPSNAGLFYEVSECFLLVPVAMAAVEASIFLHAYIERSIFNSINSIQSIQFNNQYTLRCSDDQQTANNV